MKKCTLEFNIDEMTSCGPVTGCSNLLADSRDGLSGLVVAPPLVAVRQGRLRPLATYFDAAGRAHVLFQQHREGEPARLVVECDGEWSDAAEAEAACAVAQRNGFLAMTPDGPLRLTTDSGGRWSASGIMSLVPEVVVTAEQVGIISAQTAAVTLKDVDFDRTSPQIGQSGLSALSRQLTAAYSRLATLASDGGLWLQPVVVRWHLLDSGGERVYTSAPMVAGCGWQCVQPLSADCVKGDGTLEVPALTVTAAPYRLRLSVSDDCVSRLIAAGISAIEVCASPQIHTADMEASAPWRLVRQATATPVLTVAMPGATDGFSSCDARRADMLVRLMARMPSDESQIAVVGLDGGGCDELLERGGSPALEQEMKSVDVMLSQAVTRTVGTNASALLRSIVSPNGFTAAAVATSGDTVVWGDITPLRTSAPGVSDICAGFVDEEWSGVLEVRYRGGDCVRYAVGGRRCPTAWGAAVSYPDASVAELALFVSRASGGIICGRKSLRPSPDGSRAVAVDRALSADAFGVWEGDMPEAGGSDDGSDRRCPGAVVVARLAAPSVAVAAAECCHSPVRRLMPAMRSRSSWDVSRCRFYAFSSAAAYAIGVNAARDAVAVTEIDPRGVSDAGAVARTPFGAVSLHKGQLVGLRGSVAETAETSTRFSGLAWDSEGSRLWMLDPLGNLQIRDASLTRRSDIPSPAQFVGLHDAAGRLWLEDIDELYRISLPEERNPRETQPIVWRAEMEVPEGRRPSGLILEIGATDFFGTVTVAARSVAGSPEGRRVLTRLSVKGRLVRPIVRRFAAPFRPVVSIEIDATVSPDFMLRRAALILT